MQVCVHHQHLELEAVDYSSACVVFNESNLIYSEFHNTFTCSQAIFKEIKKQQFVRKERKLTVREPFVRYLHAKIK